MHVSVAAETLFNLGPLPITNSLLVTFLVTIFLIFVAFLTSSRISKIPSRFQAFMELIIGGLLGFVQDVAGKKLGREIFPLLATFFIFIILGNWVGLLPGVGSIGLTEEVTEEHAVNLPSNNAVFAEEEHVSDTDEYVVEELDHEDDVVLTNDATDSHGEELQADDSHGGEEESHEVFVPLFRGPTADLNTTLALAIFSVLMIQYYGVKHLGKAYLKKFFDFSNPINTFVGFLELISEFSKIISFSFRLFGNIFAGEVLLTVIAFLVPFIAPLPFLGLEIFVGFVQALVFMMLSLVFISMATTSHH